MVSFYGTGYAGLLLYITRKQTAVNGRIYGYTAYHKSKKVTSEGRVYFGTDPEWRGILLCSDTPEHPFLCPLPSTLPCVGGKVQFQLHETLPLHPQLGRFYCNPETPTRQSAQVSELDCWMKARSFSFDL